jgi:hypothetical protein
MRVWSRLMKTDSWCLDLPTDSLVILNKSTISARGSLLNRYVAQS